MNDTAKKLFLAALGLAAYTEEKASAIFNDLVNKGENRAGADEWFSKNFTDVISKGLENIESKGDNFYQELLKKLNLVTKEEFDQLKQKVEELSKRVQ